MNSLRKVRVKVYLEPKQYSTLTFLAKTNKKSKSKDWIPVSTGMTTKEMEL